MLLVYLLVLARSSCEWCRIARNGIDGHRCSSYTVHLVILLFTAAAVWPGTGSEPGLLLSDDEDGAEQPASVEWRMWYLEAPVAIGAVPLGWRMMALLD